MPNTFQTQSNIANYKFKKSIFPYSEPAQISSLQKGSETC